MKRVLIIANNNLGIGGIQDVIMQYIRGLSTQYKFDAVVFNHNRVEYEEEFLSYGGHIFTINTKRKNTFANKIDYYVRFGVIYNAIRRIITEKGPYDIIHCHNYFEAAIALMAAKKCGIRNRIVHTHTYTLSKDINPLDRIYFYIYRYIIDRYSTTRIACSSLAGDFLYGNKIHYEVVLNAVDLDKYTFVANECSNVWSFINVGRWGEPKNQLFLIQVFDYIYQCHKEATLDLIGYGEGEYYQNLIKEINSRHLNEVVRIHPFDANIHELFKNTNIFLFPSNYEGLGIALLEAESTGLKCFASNGVPKEANLGYVDFLPIDKGPELWGKAICKYIEVNKGKRYHVSTDEVNIINILEKIDKIYSVN